MNVRYLFCWFRWNLECWAGSFLFLYCFEHYLLQPSQVRVARLSMDCLYDPSGLWCITQLNLDALPSIWLQSPCDVFSLNVSCGSVNGRFTLRQKVLLCKCQHGLCWFSTSQGVHEASTRAHMHICWHTNINTLAHTFKQSGFQDGFSFAS